MSLEKLKAVLGDKYKFTADYDLDTIRQAMRENNDDFAGKVPYVLEADCVDIEVEILGDGVSDLRDDANRLYADYNICVKIDEDNWRTFDSLPQEVNFDVPDMEAEMFRILDAYVTEHGLLYIEPNGKQLDEKMREFGEQPDKHMRKSYAEEIPPEELTPINHKAIIDNDKMTLGNLIMCRLEGVHLCHCDEEIELATIEELDANTLTEKGKQDWSDVLNATVEKIYEGGYGIQIGLSDVDPERLSDFSFMLAGNCSAKKYDEWVADQSEQPQDQDMNM